MEESVKREINSYLSFKLGSEIFATNVGRVLNILEMVRITEVPKAPAYMMGVINLRGEVLPVIDTRVKFGLSASESTNHTCILALEVEGNGKEFRVGALVDAVLEVMEIESQDLRPVPTIGDKYRSDFIQNMVLYNDQFIMVLDVDKVLTTDEMNSIQEVNKEPAEMKV